MVNFIDANYLFLFPNNAEIIILPNLRSNPDLEVGMPVLRANRCLVLVTPIARFHEKVNPGIFILYFKCLGFLYYH